MPCRIPVCGSLTTRIGRRVDDLVLLVEIADVEDLVERDAHGLLAVDVVLFDAVEVTEAGCEGDERVVGEGGFAEDDHAVLGDDGVQYIEGGRGEGLGEIDAADFADECLAEGGDFDGVLRGVRHDGESGSRQEFPAVIRSYLAPQVMSGK